MFVSLTRFSIKWMATSPTLFEPDVHKGSRGQRPCISQVLKIWNFWEDGFNFLCFKYYRLIQWKLKALLSTEKGLDAKKQVARGSCLSLSWLKNPADGAMSQLKDPQDYCWYIARIARQAIVSGWWSVMQMVVRSLIIAASSQMFLSPCFTLFTPLTRA